VPEWGNYAFAEKQTAGNSKIDGFVDVVVVPPFPRMYFKS